MDLMTMLGRHTQASTSGISSWRAPVVRFLKTLATTKASFRNYFHAILSAANTRLSAMIPPTVYYSKVALELSKLVFQGQKMSPP